jgi:hypothetical protein
VTVAYVLLAHREPLQVARLVSHLAPNPVFVHVDSGVAPATFAQFESALSAHPNAHLTARYRSGWASWGIVAASLEGVKSALASGQAWSHVALISGQHYPLATPTQIDQFLAPYASNSFMPHWALPNPTWGKDGGMKRVNYWHTPIKGRKLFVPIKRALPPGLKPYGGSMFWWLNRRAASYLVEQAEQNGPTTRFFKHTWIPDELYVPSMIMNSEHAAGAIDENLTYIRWTTPHSAHPDDMSIGDLDELLAAARGPSERGGIARIKLFCRKVSADNTKQLALLDALDQNLLEQDSKQNYMHMRNPASV